MTVFSHGKAAGYVKNNKSRIFKAVVV